MTDTIDAGARPRPSAHPVVLDVQFVMKGGVTYKSPAG
jgi:hypothetical protein